MALTMHEKHREVELPENLIFGSVIMLKNQSSHTKMSELEVENAKLIFMEN